MTDVEIHKELALLRSRIDILEEREKGNAVALRIQFNEYMRRLEELNHAHHKAVEDRAAFLSRDVYDQAQKEIRAWRDGVTSILAEAKGAASARAAMFAAVGTAIAIGISHYWR